jgi:hypothetical protein
MLAHLSGARKNTKNNQKVRTLSGTREREGTPRATNWFSQASHLTPFTLLNSLWHAETSSFSHFSRKCPYITRREKSLSRLVLAAGVGEDSTLFVSFSFALRSLVKNFLAVRKSHGKAERRAGDGNKGK